MSSGPAAVTVTRPSRRTERRPARPPWWSAPATRGSCASSGLPQHKDGIYEVWIARGGTVQPSTLFQVHRNGSGAAAIPEGLDDADQVMVTLEPPGGSRKPTRAPIIVANI